VKPSLILTAAWSAPGYHRVTETIALDLETLRHGSLITTYERYLGKYFTYDVRCLRPRTTKTGFRVELEYTRDRNKGLPRGTRFGVTLIELTRTDAGAFEAMAYFHDDQHPDGVESGFAQSCKVEAEIDSPALRELVERACRRGQEAFRQVLLAHWKCGCHVTGETSAQALEAAHIVDASKGGKASLRNGLLLRADIHRLYDKGLIRISKAGVISVDQTLSDDYRAFHGAKLHHDVVARVKNALADNRAIKTRREVMKRAAKIDELELKPVWDRSTPESHRLWSSKRLESCEQAVASI
jgi:hypothetical protein